MWASFLTLFALIASHSILETARDALFLAKVPATHLPWVSLAIAALSLLAVKAQARLTKGQRAEIVLSVSTFLAAGITLAFFVLHRAMGMWGLYSLYVWSGLIATLVLVHFWDVIGDLFSITQAKRLYGFIGTGSVLGAIAGSGIASLLSRVIQPEILLLVAALGFAIAGVVPFLFATRSTADDAPKAAPTLADMLTYVVKDPYASRVTASFFVATICLTLADYVFKSSVAALVPKEELGAFLGSVYFGANVLSLVCQVGLVAWLLRRISLGAALAILPALFVLGGLGIAAAPGLFAVLGLKAADGSLRYSLHRTASELLLLPFGEEARRRVKSFVDLVGQRGAQVVASCSILAFTAANASPRVIALALSVLAFGWFLSAMALRKPYIDLFRTRLKAGRIHQIDEFPELDVASIETLLATLESEHDMEVMAALDVLEREKKTNLVPALILYHPSEQVVLRALELMTRSGRANFVPVLDRVISGATPAVRAAMVAARSVLAPDASSLLSRLDLEESPEVRAIIVVNLIASGEFAGDESRERLDSILRTGSLTTKIALAEAIGRRAASGFDDVLVTLSATQEIELRRAAMAAMGRVKSVGLLPMIVDALLDEATRRVAEQVLADHGPEAFDALSRRLEVTSTDAELRWRIPPAMALCSPERTLATLLVWLPQEPDGKVRFQIIRTLEKIVRRQPSLPFDKTVILREIEATIARAFRYVNARALLILRADEASKKTPGHDLLSALLRDKEANAKGRLFRLLGLLYPSDDLGQIYRGLGSSKEARATSMELLESILRDPLRNAVIGLMDDGDERQRLFRGTRYHRPFLLDYEALLENLTHDESKAIRDVTLFHGAELGMTDLGHGKVRAA